MLNGYLHVLRPAYIEWVLDGGGNMANNANDVPFVLNGPNTSAGEVAIYDAKRGSKNNETDQFWVVYVCAAYQDYENNDNDPFAEKLYWGSTSPFDPSQVHDTNLATGGDGSLMWREGQLEMLQESEWDNTYLDRMTLHEVGHQFGQGHGQWGVMHSSAGAGEQFRGISINPIRSRVKSPGE